MDETWLPYVNIFQGSESHFAFSQGNTYPAIARPFGMNFWSPQTNESPWFYRRSDRMFQGIRCTHQPSPWMGDYGHFTLMPYTGDLCPGAAARASSFRPADEHGSPHEYVIDLLRYQTRCELSPTERGAVLRLTYPTDAVGGLQVSLFEGDGAIRIDPDSRTISGMTRANSGGVPANFACYFVIACDVRFERWGTLEGAQAFVEAAQREGNAVGAFVTFAAQNQVIIRVATSFISEAQARFTLMRELDHTPYEEVRANAAADWERWMSRVEIDAPEQTTRRIFATALYRTLLFPRLWHEQHPDGYAYHYSPYTGQIHNGELAADNGFWDTYRTVYPWFALVYPDHLSRVLNGWLNAYLQSGWLPQWSSPGHRACMIGTHSDAIFADALVKQIEGVDYALAYQACRKNATTIVTPGAVGREGLRSYLDLGYIPLDESMAAVSATLDYAYNDFCIAQMAHLLGYEADARLFNERSRSYRNLFDAETRFFRPRLRDGSWDTPFQEWRWGRGFVEGSAWQYRFAVPHDIAGLTALLGGASALESALDQMLALAPRFDIGTYPHEIHEMSEMAVAGFGQYAHSNQPVHHVLYLYAYAGNRRKMWSAVHRVLRDLYTADTLPGDEDNGEMSAWYLWSSLGLYPICPGKPVYTVSAPLFREARLHLPQGRTLQLSADAAADTPLEVTHQRLLEGGQLLLNGQPAR